MTGGHSFLGIFDRGVIKMGGHPFLRHRHFKSGQATATKKSLMHVNGGGGGGSTTGK